jgi:hypothetical protein
MFYTPDLGISMEASIQPDDKLQPEQTPPEPHWPGSTASLHVMRKFLPLLRADRPTAIPMPNPHTILTAGS